MVLFAAFLIIMKDWSPMWFEKCFSLYASQESCILPYLTLESNLLILICPWLKLCPRGSKKEVRKSSEWETSLQQLISVIIVAVMKFGAMKRLQYWVTVCLQAYLLMVVVSSHWNVNFDWYSKVETLTHINIHMVCVWMYLKGFQSLKYCIINAEWCTIRLQVHITL